MDTKFDPMSESTKRMREQNIADQKAVEGLNVYACRYSDAEILIVVIYSNNRSIYVTGYNKAIASGRQ